MKEHFSQALVLSVTAFSSNQYFPTDVLKWMKQNASSKMLLKLMQVCKYFQLKKFPYNVFKKTVFRHTVWRLHPVDVRKNATGFPNLNGFPKMLGICGEIRLTRCLSVQQFISRIEICDIYVLHLYDQNISFNEFVFFTNTGRLKELILVESKIKDRHGDAMPFECILKCLPKATSIYIRSCVPSMRSSDDLKNTSFSSNLKIELWLINQHFDFKKFSDFMINNQQIYFILSFNDKKERVLNLMRNVLTAWKPGCKAPYLTFRGNEENGIKNLRRKKILTHVKAVNSEQTKTYNTNYPSLCIDWDMDSD